MADRYVKLILTGSALVLALTLTACGKKTASADTRLPLK
jgi:hypothetical protein